MTQEILSLQAEIFKSIAHPTRLHIIQLLRDQEKCVCEIGPALGIKQSNVSRHLNLLRKEGILYCYKDGLRVFYGVSDDRIFKMMDLCGDILKDYWSDRQNALI